MYLSHLQGHLGLEQFLAMFAIVRLSLFVVILSSSTLASPLASGLRFDAGRVVAFSSSSFGAMRRGGLVPLGELYVSAIGWVTKSSR
jgi:hypothetical protein